MKFSKVVLRSSAVVALMVAAIVVNFHESASGQRCKESFVLKPNNENLEFQRGKNWKTCSGYNLIFQNDGNLVLYNRRGQVIWAVAPHKKGDVLAIQRDGNVVLYRRGRPIWDTNTNGNRGASFTIQSDGNLVVYSRRGEVLWTSNTDGN